MRKVVIIAAAIASIGLGAAAFAQDQPASTPAPQADQQSAPNPDAGKPATKRTASAAHHRRSSEWYDWYYWPWNYIPANFSTHHHR
jgi:hypothetical protein